MHKVVLVGLDGFRPDMMSPSLTPNLCRLAEAGCGFTRHRAMFPSETYVNVASILTGTPPRDHGIVANRFLDHAVSTTEPWAGHRIEMVEAAIAAHDGALITAPTVGDRLAAAEQRLWVFSSNSPGGARQKHPTVARYPDHLLFILQDWRSSVPHDRARSIVSRLGDPQARIEADGDLAAQPYLTDAFFLLADREPLPPVTVVWFGEPDHAYHSFGLGAEPTLEALRTVDAELGRLVDWWRRHPEHDRIQLMVTSDHGHITQTKRVDTVRLFRDAGFRAASHLQDGADLALVPGYCGNIRVRDRDPGLITAAAEALMDHPDAGLVFTQGRHAGVEGRVDGSFSQAAVLLDHARTADVVFTLRTDDAEDRFGFTGTCRYDNNLPAGVGYHGGLHPAEMTPLLVAAGSAFAEAKEIDTPSSVVDILPTVLSLLGAPAAGCAGRVLAEAFADPTPAGDAITSVFQVRRGGYVQELQITRLGDRAYLDHGKRLR